MRITVNDQLHRSVTIEDISRGIVSLVPSQTELLFDLGAGHLVTGVTKFCIHPEYVRTNAAVVGGTKNIHHDRITALLPGLIIANKEENNREDIERLERSFPVWVSDVNNIDSALEMIQSLSVLCNKEEEGALLTGRIKSGFAGLERAPERSALYLIWNDPMMAAGKGTFIDDMMQRSGLRNVISEMRYPSVIPETISPDLVLLSSEPYPFTEKHLAGFRKMFPGSEVLLVDGTYFSWYGSRLADAPSYFSSLRRSLAENQGSFS